MAKEFHNPEPFRSEHRPYAMAVKSGKLVFLAGQLGVEFVAGKRTVVAPGNAERQLEQIFINMRSLLDGLGAGLGDVCWIQIFVTNIDVRLGMDAVRRQYFGETELPAATMVEVSRLALPGAVVEVNAIAVIEEG
jgi:2-iminobutanoate/2-iminopropanoate deaminase